MDAERKPKRGRTGCLVALGVVLALLLALVGAGWYALQSDEAQAILGLLEDTAQATKQAQTAPGTAELRALGCSDAMVLDLQGLLAKVEQRFPDEVRGRLENGQRVVTCYAPRAEGAPSCKAVAQTYFAAGKGKARFLTQVVLPDGATVCEEDYDEEGRRFFPDERPAEAPR